MSHDDEQCLKLGRMVVRMIRDLRDKAGSETGYCRRGVTFPGGEIQLFVVNDSELADLFEKAAAGEYEIKEATPGSQIQ